MATHIIQPGETMTAIAQRFGMSLSQLAQLNNLSDSNQIFSGQQLQLSGGDTLNLDSIRIHLGTDAANTINKPNSTDRWIIDSRDGNDIVTGGTKADSIDGGGGSDTLNGNDGNDYIYGAYGNDTINGGNGKDFLAGSRGNDTLTGGAGNDTFEFYADGTSDIITDFQPGTSFGDIIDLSHVAGATHFAGILDNMTIVNGNVVITFDQGGQVTLEGVASTSELDAADFLYRF